MSGGERLVTLAAVVGAHGVTGEVKLKLFAESAESLAAHERVLVGGREMRLRAVRANPRGATARLDGVGDRDTAEALRGAVLQVPRDALPPLGEGEYYHADLLGLSCRAATDGTPLGAVAAVENFGAGDLLEIELVDGRRVLVPFRPGVADWVGEGIAVDPAFLE